MIIFDDSEHTSTSKPVLSQSGTLSPQSELAVTELVRPDSPPPYSRPATPAPRPQQTTAASSSHSTGQESHDVEAHGTHEYQPPRRKRRGKRWAKRASAVALVFILFVMAWRFVLLEGWEHHIRRYLPSSQSHPRFGGHHGPPPHHDHGPIRKPSDVSEIAKDVATLKRYCTTNASWTPIARHPKEPIPFNSSSTTLHLPLDAYSLFLLTRIPNSSGRLQVLQHSIPHAPPQVFIAAQHAEQHSLDSISVCLMEKLPGVVGVGIFTDNFTIAKEPPLDFDITLLLPVLRPGFMYDLETDLPKFSHNLNIDMPMDSVSLKSRGRPVIADLKANVVVIETSHGPVKGTIKASEFLSITTSHSPIDVNVILENNDVTFTSVDLENTDSSINATISLVSQADEGGKYDIEVSAPNTALNLTFPSAPSNPVLQVKSITTENPCHIILPPQYQGSFALTSLDGNLPSLIQRIGAVAQDVESINDSRGEILRGSVPSQNEGTTAGWVNVTTSRAGNILVL